MGLFFQYYSTSKLYRILLSVIFVSAFFISGCSKDNDPTGPGNNDNPGGEIAVNSMVINGGGYTNKNVSFMVAQGSYSISEAQTGCSLGGNTDLMGITMAFPGNQSGSFKWDAYSTTNGNAVTAIVLVIGGGASVKTYVPKLESGTINVTAYGAINGKINGNFSGTLYNPVNESEQITINCNFSISRLPDAE